MSLGRRAFLRSSLAGCAGGLVSGVLGCAGTPRGDRRAFGDSRVKVPLVGQGTYKLGEDPPRRAEELRALRLGLDLGLTHIDTAEIYADGGAEALVGEAISGRRHHVFLVSKISPDNASYEGSLRAVDASLRRLRTDHLDLYLLHWAPTRYPLAETMRAFEAMVERGKVRAIGVSNFELPAQLIEAQAALTRTRIACNQMKYNLADRHIERELLPYCRAQGIAVTGYSPFADFPSTVSRPGAVATLEEIGAKHGASAHQTALAFLFRAGVFQIPRAATREHVRDNAGALRLRLDASEVERLDRVFPSCARERDTASREDGEEALVHAATDLVSAGLSESSFLH